MSSNGNAWLGRWNSRIWMVSCAGGQLQALGENRVANNELLRRPGNDRK